MLAVVFGGGNALGAYHGGVVTAMAGAGIEAGWVAGSSIGAVTGALVAGNPPERRVAAVREFWRRSVQVDPVTSWVPEAWRKSLHMAAALQARVGGRPSLYRLRLPELLGGSGKPGLYDAGPMRRAIMELVDFDLLNSGAMRLSVMTLDLETGTETPFDTAHERLTVDHLMASAALIPDFPAVEIDGRAYVDGGLSANVPADLVLRHPAPGPLACFVVDLFPAAAPQPRRLGDAAERQTDLIFAMQTVRTLRAMRELWSQRDTPPGAVYQLSYAHQPSETAMKGFDFSQSSQDRRWQQGERDMHAAIALWRSRPPTDPGLTVYSPHSAALADAAE